MTSGTSDAPNDMWINEVAARSLLVIVPSPPVDVPEYREFIRNVNNYNEKAPFFFPNPFKIQKTVSAYGLIKLSYR